jgi:ribonuclease HI
MRLYTDASKGDGVFGIGYVLELDTGEQISEKRYVLGQYSSMDAEWFALMQGLDVAQQHISEDEDSIFVFIDCKPLVEKIRNPDDLYEDKWYTYRKRALNRLFEFDFWDLLWEARSSTKENQLANRLAREALWEVRDEDDSFDGSAKQGVTFI